MFKLPECDICLFCAHDPHLVCALYPSGPTGDTCLDFRADPELEGKQFVDFLGIGEADEATYYNGELILQPKRQGTREEQLKLLDKHPMFTGKCPQCGGVFDMDYRARVHWDCSDCGWMDDLV